MSTCPYTHNPKVSLGSDQSDKSISFCYICNKIFFKCPKCKEANRSLARFCRSCGQNISFSETANNLKLGLGSYETTGMFTLPPDSGKIQNLASSHGYVFVTTENTFFIFSANNLNQPLKQVNFSGENPQGCAVDIDKDKANILVNTNKRIYSINLLAIDKPADILYEASPSASIIHTALFCNNEVYWIEQIANQSSPILRSLKKEVIETFYSIVRPLIKVDEEKIFIISTDKLYLYNSTNGSSVSATLSSENNTDDINIGCQPVLTKQKKDMYLFGAKHLWRINIDGTVLVPHPLQTPSTGGECLAISEEGKILVARTDGFYILDSFGSIEWQADSKFIPEANGSDGTPPQVSGKYCIFSGLTGNGSALRIYYLNDLNKYSERIAYDSFSMCEPMFNFGYLIVPITKAEKQRLQAYRLKELN